MKFIEAKSIIDEAEELQNQMRKKIADTIVKYMVPKFNSDRNATAASGEIDKLLQGFSETDKYAIMKLVFIKMC